MIVPRPVNLTEDKALILEFHCRTNYESESPWARTVSYENYREKWFSTSQPEQFFAHFAETAQDPETIAEVWIEEETERAAGYVWVVFYEIKDYGLKAAEIRDLLVTPEFQGRGIGRKMLQYIEEKAVATGANLLRSETGIENVPSRRLHEKAGFQTVRVLFEKKLDGGGAAHGLSGVQNCERHGAGRAPGL